MRDHAKFLPPPRTSLGSLTNLRPQGARAKARSSPPARFNSLRSQQTVNQKQRPAGNTLLAQRYTSSGNSYFWQTARSSLLRCLPAFASRMRAIVRRRIEVSHPANLETCVTQTALRIAENFRDAHP